MDSIRGTAFLQFGELLSERGVRLRDHLRPHHVGLEVVGNFEKTLSYKSLVQIFEGSAHALHMPELGLELATRQGSHLLGPLRYLAQSAPSIGEGLTAVLRHIRFYSPSVQYRLEHKKGRALLYFDNVLPCSQDIPQIIEKSLYQGNLLIAELLGTAYRPKAVLLRHAPQAQIDVYRRYFDCPVLFGQSHNALVLQPADLLRPCIRHDPLLHGMVRFYLEAHGMPDDGMRLQVEHKIRALLPNARCTLEMVAQALDLHPRTLQRRLAEEGLDFEQQVEEIRRQQATQLLRESELTIARISRELGYLRTTSFCRAHHRWFAMTPLEHRQRYANDAAPIPDSAQTPGSH